MIAGESPPTSNPGKAAFDHPSFGKGTKAQRTRLVRICLRAFQDDLLLLGSAGTPDNLGGPAQVPQEPDDQLARIVAISP